MAYQHSAMDSTREKIKAMLLQEEKFYHCNDYLETDQPEEVYSSLHVVADMAKLITDSTFQLPWEREVISPTKKKKNSFSPCSSTADLALESDKFGSNNSKKSHYDLFLITSWRQQIYDWICSIVDTLRLDRDTVAVAFSILDRFMARKLNETYSMTGETFQLYSMVSIFVAVKMTATIRKLSLRNLIEMSQGLFEQDELIRAELEVLKTINWHVNPPTVATFCNHYLDFYSPRAVTPRLQAACRYFADLALADEFFISKSPSLIALGIVLLASQREGISLEESQRLLENLKGLGCVQDDAFDSVYQRLECLC